jgi:hypothetical protein
LIGKITGPDPYVVRGMLKIDAGQCPVVEIRLRVTAGAGGQFYWGTTAAPGFSEDRVRTFDVIADGAFHTYRIELGTHAGWAGQTIAGIRIDPGNGAAAADFALVYVRGVKE